MVIEFHSKIVWVLDTVLHSALSGWVRSSDPPLLPHQCRVTVPAAGEQGAHGQGLMLCPEVSQHPRQTLQLWHVAQDKFLCPAWLARVYKALSDYKDVLRWVISMGYVHKVLKLVLEASQWHSRLSHWRRGASWICCSKKKSTYLF